MRIKCRKSRRNVKQKEDAVPVSYTHLDVYKRQFKDNAGTEVTADILFLQKRERKIDIEPDLVHLGVTENGIAVNSYFAEHPEMMLGSMEYDTRIYGQDSRYTCLLYTSRCV